VRAARLGRGLATAVLGIAALAAAATPAPARAEDRFIVQGLFDAELWKTDTASRLLSRNEGDTASAGVLRVWVAGDFAPGLQGYALGTAYSGNAWEEEEEEEGGIETYVEQAFLRYTLQGKARMQIEGGRIVTPAGDFYTRYFSTKNPLIGTPDSYTVNYPEGLKVSGWVGPVDLRAAAINLPFVNANYVPPDPGKAWRPLVGAGVTPMQGLRFGAYYTKGPYLGPDIEAGVPAGDAWQDYDQAVAGLDFQFSRAHFELHGDFALSSYEVPTMERSARGRAWYLEPRYTFSPRFFGALRLEENEYPYIRLFSFGWIAPEATLRDIEAGVGVHLVPGAILKVTYRRDQWIVDEARKDEFPEGYAVAAQLSYTFDVVSWFERPR
jgi:hypothetical protein